MAHVTDVLLEIGRVEKFGVPCVYDLHQHVALLDDAPKLTPDLNVLFKGRYREVNLVLLLGRDVPAPLQKGHVFALGYLGACHSFLPCRPSRNFEVLVAAATFNILKG